MKKSMKLSFYLNGEYVTAEVKPETVLLDLLRETFSLTGTKHGCGIGECGACTVLVEGEAVDSCIYPAPKVDQCHVLTVEGLGSKEKPHTLQKAFLEEGAVQCGFCTPGMLMSSYALLQKTKEPTDEQIKESIAGNLCRCTGYVKIVKAVKKAGQQMGS